jgi:hypothetical protein
VRNAWLAGTFAFWAAAGGARAQATPVQAARCEPPGIEALKVASSTLCVVMRGETASRRELLTAWIERSARIVAQYYGRFPAPLVRIEIEPTEGDAVGSGRTTNDDGLAIRVRVGRDARRLGGDWVLVHEMVHLALPEVGRAHNWLAEGLAVYVEGISRAQAGDRDVADVWAEYRRSMPMGLPREGEGGMDQTSTWGRTYWGGALFCLEADVTIRERTGNRTGLQTALRAILNRTGGYASQREMADVLRIGDEATGTHALEDLYERSRAVPRAPDLAALWRRLGVPEDPKTQPFDDQAPLAAIRIAITAPQEGGR